MSRSLTKYWLFAVLAATFACAPSVVHSAAPGRAAPLADLDAPALQPLWQDESAAHRHHATHAKATLAPLVTSAMPEDAAWEGFVTPASRHGNALTIEFQGKLVMQNTGIAGAVVSPFLTMWNGASFEPLPVLNSPPTALAVWNDRLVVATGTYVLRLDGAAWDTLGKVNGGVTNLIVFQGRLVAGGNLTSVNGIPAALVAAFDGSAWSAAGTGMSGVGGGLIYGMTVHLGALVVCGSIPLPLNSIASLSTIGGTWQKVGAGFSNLCYAIASDGTYLYASGHVDPYGSLARWDGVTWTSLSGGSTSDVHMTLWNGKIVTNFPPPGGGVAKLGLWNGTSFTTIPGDSIGFGTLGFPSRLGTWGTKLVVTGAFASNGSIPVPYVLTYDGAEWATIGAPWTPGMTGPGINDVLDLMTWGGKLIAAGFFRIVADQGHWTNILGVAAWDGSHWSPLGSGLVAGGEVWLGTFADDLIAVGGAMSVVGTTIHNVARWNGTTWSAFGTGAPDWNASTAEFQSQLYVGSDTDLPTPRQWNGSAWSTVGGGTDGYVYALAQAGGRLVVGGYFANAGATPASNVAFWDGANWQAAGAGVNDVVGTAVEWLGQPVIGGGFTASGATALPGVAFWDGAQWQPMGTRAIVVQRLRVVDGELFATGDFKLPDDSIIEDTIAHWTGSDWKVLGSGGGGYAFEGFNGYLYQQGSGLVHGHPSHNLSRVPLSAVLDVPAPGPHPLPLSLSASPNPSRGPTGFAFTLPTAGHAKLTVVDVTGRVVATLADGPFDAGAHQARWSAAAPPGVYFARLEAFGGASRVVRLVRFE